MSTRRAKTSPASTPGSFAPAARVETGSDLSPEADTTPQRVWHTSPEDDTIEQFIDGDLTAFIDTEQKQPTSWADKYVEHYRWYVTNHVTGAEPARGDEPTIHSARAKAEDAVRRNQPAPTRPSVFWGDEPRPEVAAFANSLGELNAEQWQRAVDVWDWDDTQESKSADAWARHVVEERERRAQWASARWAVEEKRADLSGTQAADHIEMLLDTARAIVAADRLSEREYAVLTKPMREAGADVPRWHELQRDAPDDD